MSTNKNKTPRIINQRMVFEYLEEKILDDTHSSEEYDFYVDYRDRGKDAIMLNIQNFSTYLRLRKEMLKIYNGEEVN